MALQKSPGLKINERVLKPDPGQRLFFIDNLRWLMIIFVVVMHLNVTYSSFGSWYYIEKRSLDVLQYLLFGIYGSFTQAYFMGFLFLIAGYFVPGSFDKKGVVKFITDRLFRLGIPTLTYMLFIDPLTNWIRQSFENTVPADLGASYWNYLSGFRFIGSSGPLWFAFALLIFSVIYALVRVAIHRDKPVGAGQPFSITHLQVAAVILLISSGAFLLRLVQPIGTSFYNMQLGYFSAYIILFILGIIAYRRNLFLNIPYRFGITWFKMALWGGFPIWMIMMVIGGAFKGLDLFNGGFHWQSLAYALWESFFCVGISLGLLVLFRERHNNQGKIAEFLSGNAFAVYVFHAPILVALTMTARGIAIYPLLKMIMMAAIALPICFAAGDLIRKAPWLRKVFS